jgi:hypothetical protein
VRYAQQNDEEVAVMGIIQSIIGGLVAAILTLIGNRIIFKLTKKKEILTTENTLRIEAKRIAREKTMEVMAATDKLFDESRYSHKDEGAAATHYLEFDFRELFWRNQIFLPKEIITLVSSMMGAMVRMLTNYKYDKRVSPQDNVAVSKAYQDLINEVRRTFYFDTKDLSPQLEQEIRTMFDRKVEAPKLESK